MEQAFSKFDGKDNQDTLSTEMLNEKLEKDKIYNNVDKDLDHPWDSADYTPFNLNEEFVLKHIDKPYITNLIFIINTNICNQVK